MTKPVLRILGTRGVPAAHGGFETFAEQLSLYLVGRGWDVTVYCQVEGDGSAYEDVWEGVRRWNIPVSGDGPAATIAFDWAATRHAATSKGLCLTLGYNTAVFCGLLRLRGVPNLINMDGIEWARAKWGAVPKAWFWLNDWLGCWLGNHLIADHPGIADHLATRVTRKKITMIPYGAESIEHGDDAVLSGLGLASGGYLTVIARPEPENSLLEIVQGYSRRPRGFKLVVLGKYLPDNAYHQAVRAAASDEVLFVGAIYEKPKLRALRFGSLAYVHGHQVGGTNPSLVEALGAGNAIVAHDNKFNRWVAGNAARYFSGADGFDLAITDLLQNGATLADLKQASKARYEAVFTWPNVLEQYERLLLAYVV